MSRPLREGQVMLVRGRDRQIEHHGSLANLMKAGGPLITLSTKNLVEWRIRKVNFYVTIFLTGLFCIHVVEMRNIVDDSVSDDVL